MKKNLLHNDKSFVKPIHLIANYTPHVNFDRLPLKNTLHWHSHFELELIEKGKATHILNEYSYPLERGCVYLITPSEFHTVKPSEDNAPLSLYSLQFGYNAIPTSLYLQLSLLTSPAMVKFEEQEFEELLACVKLLLRERSQSKYMSEKMIQYLIGSILIIFFRKLEGTVSLPTTRNVSDIQKAVAYIKGNFRDPDISVQRVAQWLNLSPNYFSNLFKTSMGCSCNHYIKQMRMLFARGLLINSDLPICELAEICGFNSTSYFIKEFKAYYRLTPEQCRKENQ